MSLPASLGAVLAQAKRRPAPRLDALEDLLLRDPAWTRAQPLVHRMHGYELRIGRSADLEQLERWLGGLHALGLSIAPTPVERVALNVDESMLVCRYEACADEPLVPVLASEQRFSEAACWRVLDDVERLRREGLMHPWAQRGYEHWLIAPKSGALVFTDWSALAPGSDESVAAVDALLWARCEPLRPPAPSGFVLLPPLPQAPAPAPREPARIRYLPESAELLTAEQERSARRTLVRQSRQQDERAYAVYVQVPGVTTTPHPDHLLGAAAQIVRDHLLTLADEVAGFARGADSVTLLAAGRTLSREALDGALQAARTHATAWLGEAGVQPAELAARVIRLA